MGRRGPLVDPDLVARVLVDAIALGDKAAAAKHNLSVKTVVRYRAMVDGDPNLSQLVAEKKKLADRGWGDGLAVAMAAQIEFLTRAAREADHKDPDVIVSITEALKVTADVAVTSRILDARLADRARQVGTEAGQVAPGPGASPSVH